MPDLDEISARGQKFDDSRVEARATVVILRDTLRLTVRPVEGHEYVRLPGGFDNVPAGRGGFKLEEVFFARLANVGLCLRPADGELRRSLSRPGGLQVGAADKSLVGI